MATAALRPRSTTEIVDAAFQILRAHYGQFVMCSALAYMPLLFIRLAIVGDPRRFLETEDPEALTAVSREFYRAAGIDLFVSWLTFTIILSVIVGCASQAYLGDEVDVAAAVRKAVRRLPQVIVGAVLVYAMMIVSFMFFFLPILYVVARFFAVTQVMILEDMGVRAALRRSSQLSKGRKRHILNTLGLAALIYWVLVIGVTAIASAFGNFVLQTLAGSVVIVLVYPVVAITETLLYYDARIQSEGLDVELMTEELGPEPTPETSLR